MSRAMWMELVLGAAVAVLVFMFLTGSFNDNKEAQAAMADYTTQTNETIQMNLEDSGTGTVSSSYVLTTINNTCSAGNTTHVYVVNSSGTYVFSDSTDADSTLSNPTSLGDTSASSLLSDTTVRYRKTTGTNRITFTKQ